VSAADIGQVSISQSADDEPANRCCRKLSVVATTESTPRQYDSGDESAIGRGDCANVVSDRLVRLSDRPHGGLRRQHNRGDLTLPRLVIFCVSRMSTVRPLRSLWIALSETRAATSEASRRSAGSGFPRQKALSNHATMRADVIPIAVSIGELNYCGVQPANRSNDLQTCTLIRPPQWMNSFEVDHPYDRWLANFCALRVRSPGRRGWQRLLQRIARAASPARLLSGAHAH
jgi:hypothetical protein